MKQVTCLTPSVCLVMAIYEGRMMIYAVATFCMIHFMCIFQVYGEGVVDIILIQVQKHNVFGKGSMTCPHDLEPRTPKVIINDELKPLYHIDGYVISAIPSTFSNKVLTRLSPWEKRVLGIFWPN